MMTSMATGFPHGMQQHAGPPHPLGAPMAHNPSQPGTQAGAIPHQLVSHMGVSAPGGQMTQAAMMGAMPHGGGPNAHQMQNMASQQMYQHQQNMSMFNPQMLQQISQQQRMQAIQQQQQQHQQRQQMLAAQQHYGAVPGMQIGINGMNQQQAAQYAAMRARMPGQAMSPAQQQAIIQQQLAMQHHIQGGNPNQQQVQSHNNQVALMHQAQLAAMQQHAHVQQQQHAQQQAHQAAHQAAQQQAHAAHAAQAQAQAQAQAVQQGQQQQAQPGQSTGPQPGTPQQQSGPGSTGPNGTAQGPSQGVTPQPNPQQQPQAPPHTPQQTPNPQAQMAQAQQQVAANMSSALAQQQHQQQLLKRETIKSNCLLKLMQFSENLSGIQNPKGMNKDDLSYWTSFVSTFFSPRGVYRFGYNTVEDGEQTEKQFEVSYPALARYFHTHFDSGVTRIQLLWEKGLNDRILPPDSYFMENHKANMIHWYENGSHLIASGTLRVQFDGEQKFELFEFHATSYDEYVSRKEVILAAKPNHEWIKDWHKVNTQDSKQSPEMSKKGKGRQMKSPQSQPPDLDLPQSVLVPGLPVTSAVNQFLEIIEIMGQMNPLFGYWHAHPGMTPYAALEAYMQTAGANMNHGPRTPSYGPYPTASPAMTNQMLPNSPHIGSPAPGPMQAPGMQLQQSQQGTSSSGPSANTSPSQNNKKRRASTVKEEDGPGGAPTPLASAPQANGIQGKAKPPTPSQAKRIKGNPA